MMSISSSGERLASVSSLRLSTSSPLSLPASLAALVLAAVCVVRVTAVTDTFPGWAASPLDLPSPIVGITPAISLGLDCVVLVAASVLLATASALRTSVVLLLALAAGAVCYHAGHGNSIHLENAVEGAHWFSSIVAGIAVAYWAPRGQVASEPARALAFEPVSGPVSGPVPFYAFWPACFVAAVCIGLLPMLVMRAAQQVWIEHPQMLESFSRDKVGYITAQGWNPDSPMALAYIRRLSQAEGTGWFGLSNVFASLMAAGCVFAVCMAVLRRGGQVGATALWAALGIACGAGMLLAGSKGGFAAAMVGVVLVAGIGICGRVTHTAATRARLALIIACGCTAGVVLLVVVRGLVGERAGELSILFRWYYIEAAARIAVQAPLLGVGPGEFKQAYLLAKNPLSPEDVSSPHSVFFDYIACLGAGGWALCALLMSMVLLCARRLVYLASSGATGNPTGASVGYSASDPAPGQRFPAPQKELSLRVCLRYVVAALAAGVLTSAFLEQEIVTPLSTLVRLAGLVLGGLVAAGILMVATGDAAARRALGCALACAALAMVAHAQIEMVMITPGAALWACLLLGAACGGGWARFPASALVESGVTPLALPSSTWLHSTRRWCTRTGFPAALVVTFTAAWLAAAVLPRAARWDMGLRDAYATVKVVGELSARAADLEKQQAEGAAGREDARLIIADLSQALGRRVEPGAASASGFNASMYQLRLARTTIAAGQLMEVSRLLPMHFATQRAYHKLRLHLAQLHQAQPQRITTAQPAGSPHTGVLEVHALAKETAQRIGSSMAWSWYASLLEVPTANGNDPASLANLRSLSSAAAARCGEVYEALLRAAALAPYEPSHQARLARLLAARGAGECNISNPRAFAAAHAARALRLNAMRRLDPLVQLSTEEREELEAIERWPPGP